MKSKFDNERQALLKKYGYKFMDGKIIALGIAGYPSYTFGYAKDLFSACNDMIPVIHDDSYFNELKYWI